MSYVKRFNPYDLSEETLQAIATGRERVLESILATIGRNAEGGAIQHLQVVAPRGYGKSFLMRLVQSALKERKARGLPVAIALLPEEQHNVDAPHRLLNEIQRVLEGHRADSLFGAAFSESEEAWDLAVAELDAAIAAKLPEGRGIAIAIIENFDQLMADVFRKPRDQSRLRALLTRPGGRLMLLATATRRGDAEYEQRLFHATSLIELNPWQEESCLAFFERLRSQRQAGPMPPKTRAKAQAIAQFIGGSPRMATVLAQVLDSNDSLQAAAVLDALVDELTPYYKHRIENLSRRARTILDALLRMGEPRTQSEIAARLDTVQARIAEPFNELRARGEVVGVKAQHSAEMLYRVGDRLMAHYYRKRHLAPGEGRSLLEDITELLVGFFSPEEKRAEADRLRALGRTADAAVLERLVAADLTPAGSGQLISESKRGWIEQQIDHLLQLIKAGQFTEVLAILQQAVKQADASGDWAEQVHNRRSLGWFLEHMERHAESVDTFHQALALAEQAGDLNVQAQMAFCLGWSLGKMGRHTEAVDTLRHSIALAKQVGNIGEQAEASSRIGWSLGQLERHAEAVEALRHAITLAKQARDLHIQVQSTRHLGWSLSQMERNAEAVDILRDAIALAKENDDPYEQALSSRHLGRSLGEMGQFVEAEDMFRRTIVLAEQAGDLNEQAVASRHLGWVLAEQERYAEAVITLRSAITLAEQAKDARELAWGAAQLLQLALASGDDATIMTEWQRALAAVVMAPANDNLPSIAFWFDDAAAAALRSEQFGAVWSTATTLTAIDGKVDFRKTQRKLAQIVAEANRTQRRAAAYALAAHSIEVLAQEAAARATRDGPSNPEPVDFLRGILIELARQVTDPALLRDIAALLEQRLPSETATERALLEAAARLAEKPDDAAALERVDPDIATALERLRGVRARPVSKPLTRSKRSSTPRRKK